MKYTSQSTRFSSYVNGETPYVKNGNWWIGDSDTGVVASAVDGVSFSGVDEYYYATLATDVSGDTPNPPTWSKSAWKNSIQATNFATKNSSGVTYKYLWNVEVVKSTKPDGTLIETPTGVELFLTHNDSRIPTEYLTYYAASATSTAPGSQPYLGTNNNSLTVPTGTTWKKDSEFTGSADEAAFLFEIVFVKYSEKDENGKNLYALLSSATMVGHNGTNGLPGDDAVTYVLSIYPNSWNITKNPEVEVICTVTKYTGNKAEVIDEGFVITNETMGDTYEDGYTIDETSVFNLWVDGVCVDSETVTAVEDGNDGVRGTGTLKITTAPSSYTTSTGGVTPSYRINLDTIKTQAKVDAMVGDILEYSTYHYPIIYKDATYAYCGGRTSIKGSDGIGTTGTTTEQIRIYAFSSSTTAPALPSEGATSLGTWGTIELYPSDFSTTKYVFSTTCNKTTTYSGTTAQTPTYGSFVAAELWSAYQEGVDGKAYTTFLKLMNGKAGGLDYDKDGKLYIKGEFIESNNLLVKDSDGQTVFAATSGSGGNISLAGWAVTTKYGLANEDYNVGIINPDYASNYFLRSTLGSASEAMIVFYAGSFDPGTEQSYDDDDKPEFCVLQDGSLYAQQAWIEGTIRATSGKIGGSYYWTINSSGIFQNSTAGQYTGMMSNGRKINDENNNLQGYVKFYAGGSVSMADTNQSAEKASTLANFVVTDKGYLYAKNATIEGYIYANSGTIGTWQLTDTTFYSSYVSSNTNYYSGLNKPASSSAKVFYAKGTDTEGNNAVFYVRADGYLYATSGQIGGFSLTSNALYCVASSSYSGFYSSTSSSYPVIYAGATSSNGSNGRICIYKDGSAKLGDAWLLDKWGDTNFDCFYTGSGVLDIRGVGITAPSESTCGMIVAGTSTGSTSVITIRTNDTAGYMNASHCAYFKGGKTSDSTTAIGHYGINLLYLRQNNGNRVDISSSALESYKASQSFGFGSEKDAYRFLVFTGPASQSSKATQVVTTGTWTGSIAGGSDVRLKKDFEDFSEKYECFFDMLTPLRFKYLAPTNGKDTYRMGFIAQDIEYALHLAELQKTDFGGLTSFVDPSDKQEYLALTYTEFIALNTWQIQKLKPRMTATEQEIEKLKLEIQQLRAKLQNLQNS